MAEQRMVSQLGGIGSLANKVNPIGILEGDHLEAVYSGAQLQAKYLRGAVIDEVVSAYQYDSTGKWINTTYHHDILQSVTGLSGHNGDVYNLTAYTPFGETMQEAGPVKNFLKYTGREQDQDSGLYQYRARYYDPSIGRFISEDPKGFQGSEVNWYTYVDNNPLNANDPNGLEAVINRSGNNFDITFRNVNVLVQPPLKPAIAAGMMRNVEKVWSGLFPPYRAETSVQYNVVTRFPTGTDPSRINVTIQPGSGTSNSRAGGYAGNPANITLFERANRNTPAHEFGHNLGLNHPLINPALSPIADIQSNVVRGSNIMMYPPPGQPDIRRPDASNFNQLIQNSILGTPINNRPQYGALPDFGNSGLFGGASGGFLLYPNKSNTNMTRSVYSK